VKIVIEMVNDSDLPRHKQVPLTTLLRVASDSFRRGQFRLGVIQLLVFQNVVRATVARHDPTLANELIQAAQQIINAEVSAMPLRPLPPGHGRITLDRHGGRSHLRYSGRAPSFYVIQASTNLVDWQVVGTTMADDVGGLDFEDKDSGKLPFRFYRIVQP
jgi:hypothetical protein